MVLGFNSVLNLILAITIIMTAVGSLYKPMLYIGSCATCLGNFILFVAIIVTGVYRFSADGTTCAENLTQEVFEGVTFSDHGFKIKALFTSQLVLYCGFNCCIFSAM